MTYIFQYGSNPASSTHVLVGDGGSVYFKGGDTFTMAFVWGGGIVLYILPNCIVGNNKVIATEVEVLVCVGLLP